MKRISVKMNRFISILLAVVLLITTTSACTNSNATITSASGNDIDTNIIASIITEEIQKENEAIERAVDVATDSIELFVYDRIFNEYSLCYDTFDASVSLTDGTVLYGIAYSDFSTYFEEINGDKGYFPAGFMPYAGDFVISAEEVDLGLEITNLNYENEKYGFVLAYATDEHYDHCVVNGEYIKYGIDADGLIVYEQTAYSPEICDESLGALYSYDEKKYLYDPNVGEYTYINGVSLAEQIDYGALEDEVNRILEEQDYNFSNIDIQSQAYFAQEAVVSYFLSMQEETFMGCDVKELIESASQLDPMECFMITPDGNVILDISEAPPSEPTAVTKWVVGVSCGIAIAGSIALNVFVPAATPAAGAILGASIDVFMQVVIENNDVCDINWGKVAISATSGAIMAWACPLGAATVADSVGKKIGSEALAKLAGYGVLTFSNAIVSGVTNASYSIIEGKNQDEVWDSFLVGAALGACCTAAASALSEIGQVAMKTLESTHPENWLVKLSNSTSAFINGHQIHPFPESVESILNPKTVYEAAAAGVREYNTQAALVSGRTGGAYNDVKLTSDGNYTEVHETPCFSSTGAESRTKGNGPSIKMTKEDHRNTASWGNSKEAKAYQQAQADLIKEGKYQEAIQMDIDDISNKFDDGRYDEAIEQMKMYAKEIGWWE